MERHKNIRNYKLFILFILLLSSIYNIIVEGKSYSNSHISIYMDDTEVMVKSYFIENDRIYVPVREFFEGIGYNVEWVSEKNTVILDKIINDESESVVSFDNKVENGFLSFLTVDRIISYIGFIIAIWGIIDQWRKKKKEEEKGKELTREIKKMVKTHSKIYDHDIILDGITGAGKSTLLKRLIQYDIDETPVIATSSPYKTDRIPICFEKNQDEISVHSFVFYDTAGENSGSVRHSISNNIKGKFAILLVWDLQNRNKAESTALISKPRLQLLYKDIRDNIIKIVVFMNKSDLVKLTEPELSAEKTKITNAFRVALEKSADITFVQGSAYRGENIEACRCSLIQAFYLQNYITSITGNKNGG